MAAESQRPDAEGIDEVHLKKILGTNLPLPGEIRYLTELDEGKQDTAELRKRTDLLLKLREFKTHFTKTFLNRILLEVASDKEDTWNLAAEQNSHADETSKKIRSMMKDVSQGIAKWKSRNQGKKKGEETAAAQWLQPFLDSVAADEPHKPLIKKYDLGKAYRFEAGKEDRRQPCARMEPGENKDVDEVVAVWDDGDTWSVPGVTYADYQRHLAGWALNLKNETMATYPNETQTTHTTKNAPARR